MITRVRGTRDIIDTKLFSFLTQTIKKHFESYNFSEIITPLIEPLDLFKRSLGLQTDVVSKEMFIVSSTTSKEETICLRPEATASVVRAFIENSIDQVPWKVFSTGPMFRYERPQKGRYRQFYQSTIEIIGAKSIYYDIELLNAFNILFKDILKLNQFSLLINFLGCKNDRAAHKDNLVKFLNNNIENICATCIERSNTNTLRIFDCKQSCQNLYKNAPLIIDHLCVECLSEWQILKDELSKLKIEFILTPTLVRGLDYYNKTVFEFESCNLGSKQTFCGGGRYDSLVNQIGAKEDQPSVGAAIGIDRVILLLEQQSNLEIKKEDHLVAIVPFLNDANNLSIKISDQLRFQNIKTEIIFDGSIKNKMKKTNKINADFLIILGEDELKNNTSTIKNMNSGDQVIICQSKIINYFNDKKNK